jgi:peptide/nickel transport system permease protein
MRRLPLAYVLRRVLYLVAVVWVAATVNFVLPRITARDPVLEYLTEFSALEGVRPESVPGMVAAYKEWVGFNQPLWRQYVTYLGNMLRMDFGYSFRVYRPVTDIIAQTLPWTIGLLGITTILSFAVGTVLGAIIGWPKSPRWLQVLVPFLATLSVIPPFIVALVLIYLLAFRADLFPLTGAYSPEYNWEWTNPDFWLDILHHTALPSLSMFLVTVGMWSMKMRGMVITIVGEDYLAFAEAKGLKRRHLFLNYAIRNVLLPQTTSLALSLGRLVTGMALVEVMFGYPGVGHILEDAIRASDYNVLQGVIFFLISAIALATFIIDMIYPFLDPRISYE